MFFVDTIRNTTIGPMATTVGSAVLETPIPRSMRAVHGSIARLWCARALVCTINNKTASGNRAFL